MEAKTDIAKGLLLAADLLREHGWCQKVPMNSQGQQCLYYALYVAFDRVNSVLFDGATSIIQQVIGDPSVIRWNDVPGRSVEEVITVLTESARIAGLWAETTNH